MRIASFVRPALIRPIYLAGASHLFHSHSPLHHLERGEAYQSHPATPSHAAPERTAIAALKQYGMPAAEGLAGVASLGVGIAGIYSCATAILIPGAIISALCFLSSVKNAVKIHRRIVRERPQENQQEAAQTANPVQTERPSRLRQYALPITEATLGGVSLALDSASFSYCKPEVYYPSIALTALGLIPGLHALLSRFIRPKEEAATNSPAPTQEVAPDIALEERPRSPERCQIA